jgi:hypothetical protein
MISYDRDSGNKEDAMAGLMQSKSKRMPSTKGGRPNVPGMRPIT